MTETPPEHKVFRPWVDYDRVIEPQTVSVIQALWTTWRGVVVKTLLVLALLGVVVLGITALYRTMSDFPTQTAIRWQNWTRNLLPELQAHNIQLHGLRHLERAKVLQVMAIAQGENIISLDLVTLKQRLLDHPWIKDVLLQRQFNGNLQVLVREHLAAAIAQEGETLYILSAEGQRIVTVDRARAQRMYPDLPFLRGQPSAEAVQRFLRLNEQFPVFFDQLLGADRLTLEGWRLWLYRPDGSLFFVTLHDHQTRDDAAVVLPAPSGEKNTSLEESVALWLRLDQKHQLTLRDVQGYDLRHYPKILVTGRPEKAPENAPEE